MIASSVRSSPIIIIATTTEASTILDALSQYRGCFGGKVEEYEKLLETVEDSLRVMAIQNYIKHEKESIELAHRLLGKIADALNADYEAGGCYD